MSAEFWITLYTEPKTFFKDHWKDHTNPKVFNIAIALFLIGAGMDRFDRQLMKYEMSGNFESLETINTWGIY